MKVFLGPVEVAGIYRGLKKGFLDLGVQCDHFNLYDDPFRYDDARPDPLTRLARWGQRGRSVRRAVGRAARVARFGSIAREYDVFIYGFGTSFTGVMHELALLRRLGKKVIFQFHGSDSRPTWMDGAIMAPSRGMTIEQCIARTRRQARRLAIIGRYADAIVDIPSTGQLHTKPFANWLRVGLASQPRWFPAEPSPPPARDVVRVLHAPSHPEAKGTERIREMVGRLRARGRHVELVEVQNRPNDEVLQEIERCDVVFDQLYADYGMPTLACEAAWFARPAVLGGYAAPHWRGWLPPECNPPTSYVLPGDAEAALERLVVDRDARVSLGMRARKFVEEQWAPRIVAERYLRLARGDAPPDWLVNPAHSDYHLGVGLEEHAARALIARVIARGGREALALSHNPAWADRIARDVGA